MAKTKQVLLTTTVKTTGAWQPNRLVSFAGKQAENGEAVLGVSVYEADTGDLAAVDVSGIALVEAGAAIAAGAAVSRARKAWPSLRSARRSSSARPSMRLPPPVM